MMEYSFAYIVQMLSNIAEACVFFWGKIVVATGSAVFYLGCIAVFMAVRYLLIPLVGASIRVGASDTVKRSRSRNKSNKGKGK